LKEEKKSKKLKICNILIHFSHSNLKIIKKQIEDYNQLKPSANELEYLKHREKLKFQNYKKEERKKYLEDLIQKEIYATNIYKFLIKRKFIRKLIFCNEMNNVVVNFIENLFIKFLKKVNI
jgi:hypothetical protein